MTKSGSSVKKEIKVFADELKSKYSVLNDNITNDEGKIETLVAQREEIFVRLAKTYLPELDADDIARTLKEVQAEVQGVFRKKQERRAELDRMLSETDKTKESYQDKLEEITSSLNKKVTARDELSAKAVAELTEIPGYVALATSATKLRSDLDSDGNTLESTLSDFEKKKAAIAHNRFFRYLTNRNYDQEHAKFFDSWIAKAVAYDNAKGKFVSYAELKRTYDYLTNMPELMKKDYEERLANLAGMEKKIGSLEKSVAEKIGLTSLMQEIEQLVAQRDKLKTQINAENSRYNTYSSEKNELENTKDNYHSEAIQKLRSFLKGQKMADLKARARATSGSEDDQLVAKIEQIDSNIREFKDGIKDLKSKVEKAS